MNKVLIFTSVVVVLGLLLSASAPWIPARSANADGGEDGSTQDNTLLFFILMFSASLVGLVFLFKR
jgi:hypothetical protein